MQISWHDKSPIYRQLSERLRELILESVYRNGDALPSVRQIASEHRINPITVSKAFQLLVELPQVEFRLAYQLIPHPLPQFGGIRALYYEYS